MDRLSTQTASRTCISLSEHFIGKVLIQIQVLAPPQPRMVKSCPSHWNPVARSVIFRPSSVPGVSLDRYREEVGTLTCVSPIRKAFWIF